MRWPWKPKEEAVREELPERPEDPEAIVEPADDDPEPECVEPADPYNK